MKLFIILFFLIFNFNYVHSSDQLIFFLETAYKNNPKLNAQRKELLATKQNINISKSKFLPNISVSGSVNSNQSTNRTNQAGKALSDTSNNEETKTFLVEQKIFQGFENYHSLKKSELEVEQAKFKLKNIEQETIFNGADAYYDLIYKTKRKKFNLENVGLFERQVESDGARLQKGEITLTDLAQSESSLAGARAKLISAENEFLEAKTNFVRIIRIEAPTKIKDNSILNLGAILPKSLSEALKYSEKNNPKLLIAKLDFEISKRNVGIEKAQLAPSASINFSKSDSNDYSSTVDKTETESVKATIKWPIIKGGENYSSLKKSKLNKEKSSLILQDINNEVKTDATNAWSLYQSAESILKSTKAQVKAAEIANEGISLEYDSGNTRTTLELIQSRTLLLSAKIAKAKAERDFVISKFKVLVVLGNLTLNNIKYS